MKTPYVDPLIPPHETRDETLTRLSANIGTLTTLLDEAAHTGHVYLAAMFNRARGTNVAEAKVMIAPLTAEDKAAPAPVRSLVAERKTPAWKDAEPELPAAAALLHLGAGEFVVERRFLLVGTAVSDGSAVALSSRDQPRREQHRRGHAPRRFLPALTDPRFFQLALA